MVADAWAAQSEWPKALAALEEVHPSKPEDVPAMVRLPQKWKPRSRRIRRQARRSFPPAPVDDPEISKRVALAFSANLALGRVEEGKRTLRLHDTVAPEIARHRTAGGCGSGQQHVVTGTRSLRDVHGAKRLFDFRQRPAHRRQHIVGRRGRGRRQERSNLGQPRQERPNRLSATDRTPPVPARSVAAVVAVRDLRAFETGRARSSGRNVVTGMKST